MTSKGPQLGKKKRWGVTLRVLMVVIVVLAIGIAQPINRARRQKSAVAEIGRQGGHIGYTYNYKVEYGNWPPWPSDDPSVPRWLLRTLGPEYFRSANFVGFSASGPQAQFIDDLEFLDALPDVRALHFVGTSFPDDSLRHTKGLDLIRFYAEQTQIGDEGLAHLANQKNIWDLKLCGGHVTDEGLRHLAGMSKLRHLKLSEFEEITKDGLAAIAHAKDLERLSLANTSIGDAGLVHLKGLERLRFLDLRGTRVTDAGLVYLQQLPSLSALHLSGDQITDEGLHYLRSFPALSHVGLFQTAVTDSGLAGLLSNRPEISIEGR